MESNTEMKLPYVMAKIEKVMNTGNSLKAFATVTIANCFTFKDVRVMEGKKGLFVAMPNKSFTNSQGETKYADVCHATNTEMHKRIEDTVINAYNQIMNQSQVPVAPTAPVAYATPAPVIPECYQAQPVQSIPTGYAAPVAPMQTVQPAAVVTPTQAPVQQIPVQNPVNDVPAGKSEIDYGFIPLI